MHRDMVICTDQFYVSFLWPLASHICVHETTMTNIAHVLPFLLRRIIHFRVSIYITIIIYTTSHNNFIAWIVWKNMHQLTYCVCMLWKRQKNFVYSGITNYGRKGNMSFFRNNNWQRYMISWNVRNQIFLDILNCFFFLSRTLAYYCYAR